MSRWSREIKLANLDLNLLVALDALLQERSVTRAAAVMGVSQPGTVVRQLQTMGVHPSTPMVVEDFTAVPFLVSGSSRIALVQERLARRLVPASGVRLLPCPFDPLPLVEAVWWHPLYERDVGHRWLRDLLAEAGRSLDPV